MTLAKGQSSSRRKGKEVASNDPATRDVGEEALHFESECSDEEEAWCNPVNECTPLINPWYDTHAHFPKVPWVYYFFLQAPLGPLASFEAHLSFYRLMIHYSYHSGLMVFLLIY